VVACRAFKADPVDVATGELFIDVTDVSLPGSLPFAVRRIHQSSYRVGHAFGPAWVTNLDHRLEVDDAGVAYLGDDGTLPLFPHIGDGEVVEPGEGARLRLRADPDADGFTVTDPLTGVSEHFAPLTGMPGVTALPLVATTDRAGRRIDYGYDADGYLTEIVHGGGYRIRVARTSGGLVSGLVLAGHTPGEPGTTLVRYGYDPSGRLTEVVNSSGLAMRYSYDLVGRLVRWEDRNGTWYQYGYDEAGRVVRADGTDAILRAQFSYQPAAAGGVGRPARTVFTDSLGQVWTYEINEVGQVTAVIDPTGARTVQEWDRYHRLLGFTDPIGRTTSYGYDEVGNLIRTTLPDWHQVTTRYNTDDLPVSVRLPDGTVWSADYDSAGLLLSRSDPDAGITRYAYDDRGHLTIVVDALDQVTQVVCDPAGLPVAVTDPTGATTNVIRDAFGRPGHHRPARRRHRLD
jgi:YD repeat-containing protein